jgi:hypothetical protein
MRLAKRSWRQILLLEKKQDFIKLRNDFNLQSEIPFNIIIKI